MNRNAPFVSEMAMVCRPGGETCFATTVSSAMGRPFPSVTLPWIVEVFLEQAMTRAQRRTTKSAVIVHFTCFLYRLQFSEFRWENEKGQGRAPIPHAMFGE